VQEQWKAWCLGEVELQEVPLGAENHYLGSRALTRRSLASTAPHPSMPWDVHLHLSANTLPA
jgi:hypothetical protein